MATPWNPDKEAVCVWGDFILLEMEQILLRWESFAATRLPAARLMSSQSVRNHAPELLLAIVADLASPQSPGEQSAKSMGLAPIVAVLRDRSADARSVAGRE